MYETKSLVIFMILISANNIQFTKFLVSSLIFCFFFSLNHNEAYGVHVLDKFEDPELQALLNEDDGQMQQQLAEQLNLSQKCISDYLKWETSRIVTDDERCIYFQNFKRKKTYISIGSTTAQHADYSSELAFFGYHLSLSVEHALTE